MITLVVGGTRSGKSRLAEALVAEGGRPVVYVATGVATDPEMAGRIAAHRRRRPRAWRTVEAPLRPAAGVASVPRGSAVLVDCFSFYVSNRMLLGGAPVEPDEAAQAAGLYQEHGDAPGARTVDAAAVDAAVAAEVEALARAAEERALHLVVVTNEVGWSLRSPYPLGRAYQDLLGWSNQRLAARADRVYAVIAGLPLRVKP